MPIDNSNQPTLATEPHLPVYAAAFADIATLDFTQNAYLGSTYGGKLNAMLAQLQALNATARDDREITTATAIVP